MKYFLYLWKNTFNYKGTATRKQYWYAMLSTVIVLIILLLLALLLAYAPDFIYAIPAYGMLLYPFVVIIPTISLIVRRLHDANYSGLLALLGVIPVLNFIVFLIIGFFKSDYDNNKWKKEEH